MRLTCPNCGARYEVDESMIPAAGRDVQCSNCSTTWFQPGPRVEEVAEPTPPPAAPEAPAAPEPEAVDIIADDAVEEVEASLSDVVAEATSESEPEVAADGPIRRQIDPEVADILREEAERETELRRADAAPDPVETQDEMPLNSPEENVRAMRMAELEEAEDAFEVEAVAAAAAAGSRSELLPDIEEINSTLRATGDRSEAEADASDAETLGSGARRRGKTRRGFFLVVLLAVIGVLLYMYAPELSEAVPQLAGVMDSYVEAVNAARFWLDDMARSLASGTSGTPEG